MPQQDISRTDLQPGTQRFEVVLCAREVEVTASKLRTAVNYATDDAREFAKEWNYNVIQITAVGADRALTTDIAEPRMSVIVTSDAKAERETDTYRFDARCPVVVGAANKYAAGEAALRLASPVPATLEQALARYRHDFCTQKLAPQLYHCLSQVASAFQEAGWDTYIDEQAGPKLILSEGERHLAVEHTVIERCESYGGIESRHMGVGLLFSDGNGEALNYVQPVTMPDVWLNDTPLNPAEISWLDPREMAEMISQQISELPVAAEAPAP